MKVVVAEKPSVAKEIAQFLGAKSRRDGYFEGNGHFVTWALGHLVALQEPDDYDATLKRWTLETLPILPEVFRLKQTGDAGARKQFRVIKTLLPQADELICATDAGREGELIFRYILQQIQGTKKRPVCGHITRLWLSSLTDSAIKKAWERRRSLSHYDHLFHAARCRSEADWVVGMNATRNYTVRFGQSGLLWSVGRVQTPVLALIGQREAEIRHFQPVPWFEVNTLYRKVLFKRRAGRFSKKEEAKELLNELQAAPLTIKKITKKRERALPPQLFDLTSLQRNMNVRYGFSAADTLKYAQSLYEKKAITYPRTDSRYLTRDMKSEIRSAFESLQSSRSKDLSLLDLSQLSQSKRIFDDSKVSDHHAIVATGSRAPEGGTPQSRVYEAVVTRMIAAFSPSCEKDITTVEALVKTTKFGARGVHIVEPGWTRLYPKKKNDDAQELPAFVEGESGIHSPSVKEGETRPPKHHTEGSLLGMMETAGKLVDDEGLKDALKERGLGTPATRAAIIETLLRRKYIHRVKKELHISDLGRYLIALIQDPLLKSAELTGEWEEKLKEVERGKLEPVRFMTDVSEFTRALIEGSAQDLIDDQTLGPCPICGSAILEGNRGYGCSRWKDGCKYVLWKEYQGHTIDAHQARELLQRHLSFQPTSLQVDPHDSEIGSEDFLLFLESSGQLSHLALPQKSQQTGKSFRGSKKSPSNSSSPAHNSEKQTNSVFDCPSCGKSVVEREKSYSCVGWQDGCAFVIWKTVAGKKLSLTNAKKLAKGSKTAILKGFKSKAGKKFDAALRLENGKVVFVFSD